MKFDTSKYPTLIDHNAKYPVSVYGVECGKGWDAIISEMLDKMVEINEKQVANEKFGIAQIKEKFGGLRVYTTGFLPDEAKAAIIAAENKCSKTCEYCGDPASLMSNRGWYRVCCERCEMNRK